MKLIKTIELLSDDLKGMSFDIFFTASGYESRSSFLAKTHEIAAGLKICFRFLEYSDDIIKKANDDYFDSHGFHSVDISGNGARDIEDVLNQYVLKINSPVIRLLVDYTSMTRIWYAAIIAYFRYKFDKNCEVSICFVYCSANYVPPPQNVDYNRYVNPIEGFYSVTLPIKPTTLIIGLGYVQSRAFGLSEFFDVSPYLFVADQSSNLEYFNDVMKNNKELIAATSEENIFFYPLHSMKFTENLLFRICSDLCADFRVILAPCGPKPFTLLCLITSLRFESLDVWRISAGENEKPTDKLASGIVTAFVANFSN